MVNPFDDDEYVAKLLKEDAKNAKKKYELVGIEAFNPKRARPGAPKPNTNFLRNIIRQTDSHNAALLAREAEDSNARLKQMDKERKRQERKAEGRLTPVFSEEDSHNRRLKRRAGHSDSDEQRESRRRRRGQSADSESTHRRERRRHRSKDRARAKDSDDERPSHQSKSSRHHRHREHRHSDSSDREHDRSHRRGKGRDRNHRHRSRTRSASPRRRRSRSPSHHKHKHRDRAKSPHQSSRTHRSRTSTSRPKSPRRASPPASDSDPLESILGPLPPPSQPASRPRGRGAHKLPSQTIESRFSASYDPSIDVRPPSDAEDDWGDTLEAYRDRQRWKQQGAERLKAAGFTEEQVRKWEKGEHKDEDDVKWSKKGQAREWDRGKVVDGEGDVELVAEWGRLK